MACVLHTGLRPCKGIPCIEFLLFPPIYWFYFSFPLCVPVSPHVDTVHMNVDNGGIGKPKCEIPGKKRVVVISHDLWYLSLATV